MQYPHKLSPTGMGEVIHWVTVPVTLYTQKLGQKQHFFQVLFCNTTFGEKFLYREFEPQCSQPSSSFLEIHIIPKDIM